MKYLVKTPWWLRNLYSAYTWRIRTKDKTVYLTFDDGPHPVATPFVLDELKKYNAKATFFCIGKNVLEWPAIYGRILQEGHSTGNHTQHHLNGWKTEDEVYLKDVKSASQLIKSSLFRPPYGRIKRKQAKQIPFAVNNDDAKIIMWDVLSGDFDNSISKEQCLSNVTKNSSEGSIIVFHDSEKALTNVRYTLPEVLRFFSTNGFEMKSL